MKFGSVETVEGLEFVLPADHSRTAQALEGGQSSLKVYTGCGKWGRKEWVGLIYPEGEPQRNFFKLYAQNFNSIELNATNYRLPNAATVKGWAENCSDEFRFCPKVHQSVTMFRRLRSVQGEMSYFKDVMEPLGKKLGAVLVQLPHNFTTKGADDLQTFIKEYHREFPLAIEFRHASWFDGSEEVGRTFDLMEELGVTAVITDTAGRRDAVHMRLTSPTVFIRYQGYALHPTDFSRLDAWIERLGAWMNNGLKEVYFFMHQDNEMHTPRLCDYFAREVTRVLGVSVKSPNFIA